MGTFLDDHRCVGGFGFTLFIIFCFVCIVQGCKVMKSEKSKHKYLQLNFIIFTFISSLCDGLYFMVMMIRDDYSSLGYIFHMLGMCTAAVAFSVVMPQ